MRKRKTDEQFKQEVYDLVGNEYVFLEHYQGALTKIRVKHNECGNVYGVRPSDFIHHGRRCPYCNGNAKKTDEEFKQEIYSLVGNEYVFLEPYQGAMNKIKVKHNKCGNVYMARPSNFLRGDRCPYCNGNAKKTDEEFKQEVFGLVSNEYTFLEPYANAVTKLKVKHNKCGNVYEVTPNSFFGGNRCPYCFGNLKKTDDQFKQEVYTLVGDEYTFLDKYVNDSTKLKVKHTKCNNVYEVKPSNFLQGQRCPYCSGKHQKTDEEFKQEVYDLVGNEYVFLDTYVNNHTKLKVKHKTCGNVYEVTPTHFLIGTRCPFCNVPKGELILNKLLDTLNLNYETQQTFDDLIDKSYLSYDFYIPDQNILIEYQGKQHYQAIDHFGGEAKFKIQQKHDQMKLDYAKEHGYNLIAVPYTEDTLSKIKKYLIKHGLKS